jgi:hypothetical protein
MKALKKTDGYIKRMQSKPKKRSEKAQLKDWFLLHQQATVEFFMSTVFPCQAAEEITTIP